MTGTPTRLQVPLHPALLALLALATGLFGRWLVPGSLGLGTLGSQIAGGTCFLLAVVIGGWAFHALHAAGTPPDFGEEVVALAVVGPYRWSRNPLYVALSLTLAGTACLLDSVAVALAVPALVVALDRMVIQREERFLAQRFGSVYVAYAGAVRRWL
ncbi:MAG: isoprenylcysteine carboxylmethyltransferase family protein [Holophagales bacterium]|nr:MAG: isoprenylcysteine carboxylmethyltransferase family protein [Holophagales bacterium]